MTFTRKHLAASAALLAATLGLVAAGSAMADRGGPGMEGRGAFQMFDFESLDADGDGRITRDEVTASRAARVAALDADGDGRISRDEMKAAQMREAEARADRMVDRMMEALDADGDGFLTAAEMAARPAPVMMFDRIDADGDGAITKEEVEAARARMAERHGTRGERGHHRGRPHQMAPEN